MRWSAIDFENKTSSINHKVIEAEENGTFVPMMEDVQSSKTAPATGRSL